MASVQKGNPPVPANIVTPGNISDLIGKDVDINDSHFVTLNAFPYPAYDTITGLFTGDFSGGAFGAFKATPDPKGSPQLRILRSDITKAIENTTHSFGGEANPLAKFLQGVVGKLAHAKHEIKSIVDTVSNLGAYSHHTQFKYEPPLFDKTERRSIDLQFRLFTFSDSERDVHMPIQWIKYYSAASLGDKNVELLPPHLFTIRGGEFTNMQMGLCTLKGLSVAWNVDTNAYDQYGLPISAEVSFTLEEVRAKFRNDFSEPIVKITTNGE